MRESLLTMRNRKKTEKWFDDIIEAVLKKVGVGKGQAILDFGCGSGNYTVLAAKMVGEEGVVYALDKDEGVLNRLIHRINLLKLENVKVINTFVNSKIPLKTNSMNVVFLFDVLHSYYSSSSDRRRILREVHRVLKSDGFLVFYPGDPEVFHNHFELSAIKREIEEEGFYLESEFCGKIIHEDNLERGCVSNYRKRGV